MNKSFSLNETFFALISGTLFGAGLVWSEMVNPFRVLGFLNLAGEWDPTLAFVMGGALMITLPGFYFIMRRSCPLLAKEFYLPNLKHIDRKLVIGASMFGLGWGLIGLCPGPAIVALVTGKTEVIVFVVSMLVGMAVHDKGVKS